MLLMPLHCPEQFPLEFRVGLTAELLLAEVGTLFAGDVAGSTFDEDDSPEIVLFSAEPLELTRPAFVEHDLHLDDCRPGPRVECLAGMARLSRLFEVADGHPHRLAQRISAVLFHGVSRFAATDYVRRLTRKVPAIEVFARDVATLIPSWHGRVNWGDGRPNAILTGTAVVSAVSAVLEGIGSVHAAAAVPVQSEHAMRVAVEYLDDVAELFAQEFDSGVTSAITSPAAMAALGARAHSLLALPSYNQRAALRETLLFEVMNLNWSHRSLRRIVEHAARDSAPDAESTGKLFRAICNCANAGGE